MGEGLGRRIKLHRLSAGLTQAELAQGIISVSYLSKIENEDTVPGADVIELICSKLNIPLEKIKGKENPEIIKKWFESLLDGNKNESLKLYHVLQKEASLYSHTSQSNLIEIHKLRFNILNDHREKVDKQYNDLKQISKMFNQVENYYWLKFAGIYHYTYLSYDKALTCFQKAVKHISAGIYFRDREENDLYYMMAASGSKLRNTNLTLFYGLKALEYYQSIYDLKKCSKCHILLGIAYQRSGALERARENYGLAADIGELLKDQTMLALSYQNLGKSYSLSKESEKAVSYYKKSYELRKESRIDKRIIPISSLMKEYYHSLHNLELAKYWLEKGLHLSKNLAISDSIYVYEFKVYKELILGTETAAFERLITKEVLPFFEEKRLFHEKYKYLTILADYFFKENKYKKSAIYYREANKFIKNNRSDF